MQRTRCVVMIGLVLVLATVTADLRGVPAAQDAQHRVSAKSIPMDRAQVNRLRAVLDDQPEEIPFPTTTRASKNALIERGEKVDPRLFLLADELRSKGETDMRAKAEQFQVPLAGSMLSVVLLADDEEGVEDIKASVTDAGGRVTATLDRAVFARVPARALTDLGRSDALYYMTAQPLLEPQAPVLRGTPPAQARDGGSQGEGAALIQAHLLHAKGITGKGVKIGVLDFGFQGLARLVEAGEIQSPAAVKAFGAPNVENGEVHGAACAEIIHDMAPDAELYLASVGGGDGSASMESIVQGAQWLAEQGVHIISFSGGADIAPRNGKGLMDALVGHVTQKYGVAWVNAAGNSGGMHWGGIAADTNRDEVVELGGGSQQSWGIAFQPASRNGQLVVAGTWDDWGDDPMRPSSSQDLDMYLFLVHPQTRKLQLVGKSENPQRGRGSPVEVVGIQAPDPNLVFVVVFRAMQLTRPVKLHVFRLAGGGMEPRTPLGSISNPATAVDALAVGAIDVRTTKLESYSSQGLTDDERQKVDVVAPDNVLSAAYAAEGGRFPGTSAACPHAAGFAALLKQLNPGFDQKALRQAVTEATKPMGSAVPNPEYGFGLIDASKVKAGSSGNTGGTAGLDATVAEWPEELGERMSQRVLGQLWRMAGDQEGDDLGAKVVVGKPIYRIGDGLRVGFQVRDEDCYYALVHRDANGAFSVLAPTRDDRRRLRAGGKYTLPENEGETIRVREPAGREGFLLVCATEDTDIATWVRDGGRGRTKVGLARVSYEVER